MPRKARMIIEGEPTVYHVISRTALDGYVLGDVEKDYLLQLIRHLSSIYFSEVLGFCLMGNHFHLVVRMMPGESFDDAEIQKRFTMYFGKDSNRAFLPGQVPSYREKWESLSEFVKEIKQTFSRFYNKRHKRKGFFWSDRFKSVIVEDGETLINCLAYVDLNPVRAGLVDKPEQYRWNSLGYHIQTKNKKKFLSMDFGLTGQKRVSKKRRLEEYRQFVFEKGSMDSIKGKSISKTVVDKESKKDFKVTEIDRFLARTRYFSDSAIIGSRGFVERLYQKVRCDDDPPNKYPKLIAGLEGVYSLKRLSENI